MSVISIRNMVDPRYRSGARCECDGVTAALTLAETESRSHAAAPVTWAVGSRPSSRADVCPVSSDSVEC